MKNFRLPIFAAALLTAIMLASAGAPLLALATVFVVSALVSTPTPGMVQMPTLTTSEIVADVFAAFRKMVPALRYFATDFSSANAKYNQQIIAHVAALPSVVTHDTSNGFFYTPTDARTLLTDVPVTIDTWKDVILKFTANNLVADRTSKYLRTVEGAAFQLGKAMIDSVLGKCTSSNLSNSLTCTQANATAAKLRLFTATLNAQGAGPMRHGLVNSGFMTGLLGDTVIGSGDYFDQRQEAGPFAILNNIAGFQSVMEYPDYPANNTTIGTTTVVAATDVMTTSAAHGLVVGDRIRGTTTAGGLTADTTYYVLTVPSATTLTLSATLGGSTLNLTPDGAGPTIARFENDNGIFFEDRAIVIASRLPSDSIELAQSRGVPVPMKAEPMTDPESGLTVLALERFNTSSLDLELCFSVMFGSAVGRQGGTAATLMDNGALRIIES